MEEYFANLEADKIGPELVKRVSKFYQFLDASGYGELLTSSFLAYHGLSHNRSGSRSHGVQRGGKHGQLSMVKVNHYRNIGQHIIQLTTSQKPAPQPIATNTDAKSQEQVTVAKGVLEYYSRDKRVDRILRTAAEHAVVFSEGFVRSGWDTSAGSRVGNKPDGSPLMEGDCVFENVLPFDCIRDPSLRNAQSMRWVIIRRTMNKHDVAAMYASGEAEGDKYNAIMAQNSIVNDKFRFSLVNNMIRPGIMSDTEEIFVYEFFHESTPSVPDGKMCTFLDDGTVLMPPSPLPYARIPVRRISAAETIGSPFGYSSMFDLLGIQEVIDALYSAISTNQMTFGVQIITQLRGSGIEFRQLARGLSLLEYDNPAQKPEPMNLTSTPKELFDFIGQLESVMETISGVNSVVRGNPETSLKSGSALALVQSQAIQFSSGLQQSYAQLVEDVYTDTLNILKKYANSERIITIVGKYNRPMLRSFSGESIKDINRVVVDAGSALSQTIAGRTQIAQDLLQSNLIKRPEEYIAVINTGKLDPMLEGDNAELILIRSENEDIAAGKPAACLPTDDHVLHIKEHKAIMASPEVRNNPQIVKVYGEHISEHIQFLADPALINILTVLGQTPLATAVMPVEQAAGGTPPSGQQIQLPDMAAPENKPSFPTNPATGNKWDPQTGGGIVDGGENPDVTGDPTKEY